MAVTGLDVDRHSRGNEEAIKPNSEFENQRNNFREQRRPQRPAPNQRALLNLEYHKALNEMRAELSSDPRKVMIQVSGWIPQPTAGLPLADSRARDFLRNISEAKSLLDEGKREQAFKLLIKCHHDFGCAQYIGNFPVAPNQERKQEQQRIKESVSLFAEVGEAFRNDLAATIDKDYPGQSLRILEEINIAAGKDVSSGLEKIYMEIAIHHEPLLGVKSEAQENPQENQKRKELEATTQEYNSAVKLYNQKSYGLAQTAFEAFLKKHPNHPSAKQIQTIIGECSYQQTSLAVKTLESDLETLIKERRSENPNAALFSLVSDKLDWENKVTPVASQVAKLAETDKERAGKLYIALAEIQSKAGLEDEAIAQFANASALLSDPSYAEYSIGVLQQQNYAPKEAQKTFTAFCAKHPNSPYLGEVLLRQAQMSLKADKFDEARSHYQEALSKTLSKELRETALAEAGALELSHGDATKGRDYLATLLKEFPKSKHAELAQTQITTSSKNERFSRAVELSKSSDSRQEAIALFTELATEFKGTKMGEQCAYRAVHHSAQAKKWSDVSTLASKFSTDYQNSEFRDEVAELNAFALREEGKLADSLKAYNELIKNYPKHERIETWKSEISKISTNQLASDFNELVDLFEKKSIDGLAKKLPEFIERHQNDPRIDALRYNYATLLANSSKAEQAIATFESLAQSSNADISIRSQLNATTLARNAGDLEKAAQLIESFISKSDKLPDSELAKETLSKMKEFDLQILHKTAVTQDSKEDFQALSETIATMLKKYPNAQETAAAIVLDANNILSSANDALSKDKRTDALRLYQESTKRFGQALSIYQNESLAETTIKSQSSITSIQSALEKNIASLELSSKIDSLRNLANSSKHEEVIALANSLLETELSSENRDESMLALANAYSSLGKNQEAISTLESLIEKSSSIADPQARNMLAEILLSDGKIKEAGVRFAETAALESKDSYSAELKAQVSRCQIDGLFGLLRCYQKLGATTHANSTKESILAHPALSAADKTNLENLLK